MRPSVRDEIEIVRANSFTIQRVAARGSHDENVVREVLRDVLPEFPHESAPSVRFVKRDGARTLVFASRDEFSALLGVMKQMDSTLGGHSLRAIERTVDASESYVVRVEEWE